jgi:hypothetical protein
MDVLTESPECQICRLVDTEAARQQKMLNVEYEAKMQQKMKAKLEIEAVRQQKLLQIQEPAVSVPPLGGDAGWTEAELQKMDNKLTIVKVIAVSSAFAPFLLFTHSTLTLYMSLITAGNEDRWFANQTRHESQPRTHHRKTCRHTTSHVLVLPRMTEVYPHTSS